MSSTGNSLGNVSYDLRPAKQVERLMLLDAFKRLERAGLPICKYHYVGMGSTHFYDYVLFHKYLGITKMTSAEGNRSAEKRVKFNKPFGFVDIAMGPIGDLVAKLPPEERVILWLDYDDRLKTDMLRDLGLAVGRLAPGSLVLFTVDVAPPSVQEQNLTPLVYYRERLGEFVPTNWSASRFGPDHIVRTVLTLVDRTLRVALQGRAAARISYEPFACFTYKDGHRMLSFGGVIATQHERDQLKHARLEEESYYRGSLSADPFDIRVPGLTRRERLHLDQFMPASPEWKPSRFDLPDSDLQSYKQIYRFAPTFAEVIA